MIRNIIAAALSAMVLSTGAGFAEEDGRSIENIKFPFDGIFGKWDEAQLQRGLQVYTQSCAACHGLKYVPLRTLGDLGYNAAEVRSYASDLETFDAELDDFRPRLPTDNFPVSSLENAPDLSLMAKARVGFSGPYGLGLTQLFKGVGGPEYIVSILTSYSGEEKEEAGSVIYENPTFPGGFIAMPQPLFGDDVEFTDGSPTDLKSEAVDVAAFLAWAAEPKMMVRKKVGFLSAGFLTLLTVLLYFTNKRIWKPVKNKTEV